jgi:two-component system nitrate/nitrite sensor histidine kinase NarX
MNQAPYLTKIMLAAEPQALPVERLFAEISAELSSGNDLEALLEKFLIPVVRLASARAGSVRRLSDDGKEMLLVGAVGLPEAVLTAERSVDRDCGVCGLAAGGGHVEASVDLSPCRQRSEGDYFERSCVQVLAVPLRHRGEVLGVYNLFFDSEERVGAEISVVLRSVGELLGLALHNARLERENLRITVMNERQMMANEVHDAVAQTLAFMKMRLPLLDDAIRAHDEAGSLKYCADLRRAVGEAHASLREILTLFRTRMDPQGLVHALRGITNSFKDRTGIALEFCNQVDALELSVEQEVQVFHIAQEALANIAKHSLARQARLVIDRTPGRIEMVVEDDGSGLAAMSLVTQATASASQTHYGIEIMRERARHLGGTVTVGERQGGGTRVHLVIPDAASRIDTGAEARI